MRHYRGTTLLPSYPQAANVDASRRAFQPLFFVTVPHYNIVEISSAFNNTTVRWVPTVLLVLLL